MTSQGHCRTRMKWQLADRVLEFGDRPLIMGIVNVTPDSFSDGGRYFEPSDAINHGISLVEQGADLLDIGGESTRPGATPLIEHEEFRRVLPVVTELAKRAGVPISVDTSKSRIARACLDAGAEVINDVTALQGDPEMAATVRGRAGMILMHMRGTPSTMQNDPRYQDVVGEVGAYLKECLNRAVAMGIEFDRLAIDPGIGFGKTHEHNVSLLSHLGQFQELERPVCLGVSRKGILSKLAASKRSESERLAGSLAVACLVSIEGTAQILRVHDVRETCDAVEVCRALAHTRCEAGT